MWDVHFRATPLSLQADFWSLHTARSFFDDVKSMFHFDQKEMEVIEQGYILGNAKHSSWVCCVFSYLHPPNTWL